METENNYLHKLNFKDGIDLLKIDLPSRKREWMDENGGHAYKCLPLSVANGFGWHILCPISFDAVWDGNSRHENSIKFNFYPEKTKEHDYLIKYNLVSSHFGAGIITFSGMNYILRTSPGHNIFLKGPTNYFKHGAQALEAIIETDWIPYNFTLNWKITKPNEKVEFKIGEPIGTFFPIPRNYIEKFDPAEKVLSPDDPLIIEHQKWVEGRKKSYEGDKAMGYYTRGIENVDENKVFKNHQRSIIACPFKMFNK